MRYAIGVGANRGDRRAAINAAAGMLAGEGITLVAGAALVETAAVVWPGGQGAAAGAPAFLNGAWLVDTALGPHQLLHRLQAIETALGRVRTERWGPRTIDLDLLLAADGTQAASAVLTLPHPLLHERVFVLRPLAAIAGSWRHPLLGLTVAALLVRALSTETCTPQRPPPGPPGG